MGTMKSTSRRPLGQQVGALNAQYPEAAVAFSRLKIVWVGELQPSPLSRVYLVRVEYQPQHGRPKVTVADPPLQLREGEISLPHVFPGNELCLHVFGEWNDSMPLTDLIPWASEWLFFYELWVATGAWLGGGQAPPPRAPKRTGSRTRGRRGRGPNP